MGRLKHFTPLQQLLILGVLFLAFNMADALLTAYAVNAVGAFELNPFVRPIAGNAELFLAAKIASTLLIFWAASLLFISSRILPSSLGKWMLALAKALLLGCTSLAFLAVSWGLLQLLFIA